MNEEDEHEQDAYRCGVDIDLEAAAVKSLVSEPTFRRTDKFAMASRSGICRVHTVWQAVSLAVDGVGTKMLVADVLKDWSTVG